MTVTELNRAATEDDAAAEARLRRELAAVYRLVAHFKMTDLILNHISVRLPCPRPPGHGHGHRFLINRCG
jgi:ribulose-5-phosphate 4-epimerase/fuculose-1-phosphate aldolase